MAKMNAPVRSIERERKNLSKVVFFWAKMNASVKGGMERERESISKVVSKSFKRCGFLAKMNAQVTGMERGKLLLLRLSLRETREGGRLFRACFACPSKVVVFWQK